MGAILRYGIKWSYLLQNWPNSGKNFKIGPKWANKFQKNLIVSSWVINTEWEQESKLEVLKSGSHLLQNKPQIDVPMVPFLTIPRQRVLLHGQCCFKSLKWTGANLGGVESNDRIYSKISPFDLKLFYQVNYPIISKNSSFQRFKLAIAIFIAKNHFWK